MTTIERTAKTAYLNKPLVKAIAFGKVQRLADRPMVASRGHLALRLKLTEADVSLASWKGYRLAHSNPNGLGVQIMGALASGPATSTGLSKGLGAEWSKVAKALQDLQANGLVSYKDHLIGTGGVRLYSLGD